jgi:alpha-tubulin suppressor-like RCC1 family protein
MSHLRARRVMFLASLSPAGWPAMLVASILAACGGNPAPRPEPVANVPAPASSGFSSVSAGGDHVCAIAATGAAWCWGQNRAGQLGNGATGRSSGRPVAVVGGLKFAMVSAGNERTCAVTAAGAVWCWGISTPNPPNTFTEVGDSVPVLIAGGLRFAMVSVGSTHVCGVTTDGAAYCWGNTVRRGNGWQVSSEPPILVPGGLHFTTVSAANSFSCGLTSDGNAYCWGSNAGGRLGIGASMMSSASPVRVAGELEFTALSSGIFFSCGVTTRGAMYCWGPVYAPTAFPRMEGYGPAPVAIPGDVRLTTVSVGDTHGCGITAEGAGYCWGYNFAGQLGDGTLTNSTRPVAVAGGLRFASVTTGDNVTCGVTPAGAAHCWGQNFGGQLGHGTLGGASSLALAVDTTTPPSRPAPAVSVPVAQPEPRRPVATPYVPGQTYFDFQVTTPVKPAPGTAPPVFPRALAAAGVSGEVLAQFVVDTMGVADPATFKVLKSTRQEFTDAVIAALPAMRFIPAELAGHKVLQLVQQPFSFYSPP